ncbi:DUF1697 domain-containing protein [soil metagenome]
MIRVAFIRGVGGGIRPLPMAQLRSRLEEAGFAKVRSYIASGNLLFDAPPRATARTLSRRIAACIAEHFGFEPLVVVQTLAELERAVERNPYPAADAAPTSLHLFFLDAPAKAARFDEMDRLKSATEQYRLDEQKFYLYTPDGFGVSKLAERVDRLLGVPATARNWRTIHTMIELAKA